MDRKIIFDQVDTELPNESAKAFIDNYKPDQELKPIFDFDEIRNRIVASLNEADGETLADLHNMICSQPPVEYNGDSMFQTKDPPAGMEDG